MLLDASLSFVPVGAPLSCVGSAGVSFASNTIDLLGQGVGTAPTNIFGASTVYGDAGFGLGLKRMEMAVATGTAFATANSATLNVQLQWAADPGAAGNYTPSSWTTDVETGVLAPSTTILTANQVIFRFPWLPPLPANARPRFLRLYFVIPSGTNFTAGTIAYAVPSLGRDDYGVAYVPRNYAVA